MITRKSLLPCIFEEPWMQIAYSALCGNGKIKFPTPIPNTTKLGNDDDDDRLCDVSPDLHGVSWVLIPNVVGELSLIVAISSGQDAVLSSLDTICELNSNLQNVPPSFPPVGLKRCVYRNNTWSIRLNPEQEYLCQSFFIFIAFGVVQKASFVFKSDPRISALSHMFKNYPFKI